MLEFLTVYVVFAVATACISIPLIYRKVVKQLEGTVSFIDTMGKTKYYIVMWVFSFLLAPVVFYVLTGGEKTHNRMINSLADQLAEA